jgi:hypothetical protein
VLLLAAAGCDCGGTNGAIPDEGGMPDADDNGARDDAEADVPEETPDQEAGDLPIDDGPERDEGGAEGAADADGEGEDAGIDVPEESEDGPGDDAGGEEADDAGGAEADDAGGAEADGGGEEADDGGPADSGVRYVFTGYGTFPPDLTGGYGYDLGDIDGDGDTDMVVAGGTVEFLYVNVSASGGVRFERRNLARLAGAESRDVDFLDPDGDGTADQILVTRFDGAHYVSKRGGDGEFAPTSGNVPFTPHDALQTAVGDLDGDGCEDLVVASAHLWAEHPDQARSRSPSYIFYGTCADTNGDGVWEYAPPAPLGAGDSLSCDADLADVDGDRDLDVLIVNHNDTGYPGETCGDCLSVLYRNEGPGAGGRPSFSAQALEGTAIHGEGGGFCDVDGDGDLDIVIAARLQASVLLRNDGSGAFSAVAGAIEDLPDRNMNYHPAFARIDGDANTDLLLSGEMVRVLLGAGDGTFRDVTVSSGWYDLGYFTCRYAATNDFSGDGHVDFIAVNGWEQNRLYLGAADPPGSFVDLTVDNLPPDADMTRDIEAGDVDGDTDPDVVLANEFGAGARLWLNRAAETGEARFVDADPAGWTRYYGNLRDVELFDGDGDLDGHVDLDVLFAAADAAGSPERTALFRNDATGSFTRVEGLYFDEGDGRLRARFPPSRYARAADTGDVDGDGDADVVLATAGACTYLENRSTAAECRFVKPLDHEAIWPQDVPGAKTTEEVELGDIDGDTDLDVVVAYANLVPWDPSPVPVLVYRNTSEAGALRFELTPASGRPFEAHNTKDVDLVDVDRDGDLDLFVSNWGRDGDDPGDTARNRLYLNDGRGAFAESTEGSDFDGCLDHTMEAEFEDIDGDGDPDLLTLSEFASDNKLYRNDFDHGAGFVDVTAEVFELAPEVYREDIGESATFVDVDADGLRELFVATDGQTRLLRRVSP